MQVRHLPFDPGPAGWTQIVSPQDAYPALDNKITVDFVVVGAGFAGLSAARRLRQLEPQASIAVLEARTIGEGSSCRNSGFMIDLPHNLGSKDYVGQVQKDRQQIEANREAIEFARQTVEEFKLPAEAFQMSGKINAAATQAGLNHNEEYAAHLSRLDEPYERLDEKQMYDLSGSRYYLGGLATPGNAMIKPGLYVRGIARGVHRDKVQLFEKSPVTRYQKLGNAWQLQTPNGSLEAKYVVLAVNGHIESFGFFRRRLMHLYLYGSMTRCLTPDEIKHLGGESSWGFTPADSFGSTVRRISGIGGERILIRNGINWAPKRTISELRPQKARRAHNRSFQRRFPNLVNVNMEYSWGGLLCLSRNAVPAFGELEPGLFAACCQNGLGVVQGTLHGKLIAEMICGQRSSTLERVLQLSEPKKLPPEPFTSIGANVRTLWGEFKAGKER